MFQSQLKIMTFESTVENQEIIFMSTFFFSHSSMQYKLPRIDLFVTVAISLVKQEGHDGPVSLHWLKSLHTKHYNTWELV